MLLREKDMARTIFVHFNNLRLEYCIYVINMFPLVN